MHKNIVFAIKDALTKDNRENLLKITIQEKDTAGFWGMLIRPKKGYEHLIPHIEAIGLHIGRYYGEGLWIRKTKKYIMFN